MKKKYNSEMDDDLRPEYDFSKMRIVARGPKRKVPGAKVIHLDPDVARVFPDDATVNETLRLLMRVAKNQIDDNRSKHHAG